MLRNWLEDALYNKLMHQQVKPTGLLGFAQRLLSFAQVNDLLSATQADTPQRRLAALAGALDVRFDFKGLENLELVADRPVILFGNHPTGGGNVLGMSLLLANHFSNFRILGNRHMKFISSLSETLIPVDPFCSGAAINMDALLNLRRDFGTKYRALGVFPAGISSELCFSRAAITDRRWSDAFVRIASHHDALLLPVWFSGRNRLRYYMAARLKNELGFLALPAEFLRLRGKTVEVVVGKPISPDLLRHIPKRQARVSFLRASVYELGRERAIGSAPASGTSLLPHRIGKTVQRPRPLDPIPLGENLVAKFVDAASMAGIEAPGEVAHMPTALDRASYHMILTRRGIPLAYWQVLDWGQFTDDELGRMSPVRTVFRLPAATSAQRRHWLEIVSFRRNREFGPGASIRRSLTALGGLASAVGPRTELVGLLTSRSSNHALASLDFALLQKSFGDDGLLRARAQFGLLGATRHHDWRPQRKSGTAIGPPGRSERG